MSDVFISYQREDQERVAPLVAGLREAGLSVWWDRDLPGGEAWRQKITEALEQARCVVVVWSHTSVSAAGECVHEEAGRAKARGVLLPVRIDPVTEPLGFGQIQSLDLVGWRGRRRDRRFRHFVASVKAVVTGGPRPRAVTPGRLARWAGGVVGALAVVAAVLGTVADVAGLAEPICRVPGIHALCARWGWGGVATAEEEALWKARVDGDCAGLRAYLAQFPGGAFAQEAERRLQAMTIVAEERWRPQEQPLPLVVPLLFFVVRVSNLLAAPQPEPVADASASARDALVQRLVLDRAAAIVAVQRVADAREEQLSAELSQKDRQLRAEIGKGAAAQTELAAVTTERQRLVDELAARDRQFAAEIGEYRRQVASIASSPDPRKRAALERYAEGDREGAFLALVEIQRAETKAVAAGWREIAALAADRMDRGEMTTADVIPFYEEAQRIDPDDIWGWIELRRLYMAAGRLPEAKGAAEKALARAQGDRDRSVAISGLGNVLVAAGDLANARSRFEEALAISERLAAANPSSATLQRVPV